MTEQPTNSPLHQPAQHTPNLSPAPMARVYGTAPTSYSQSPQERYAEQQRAAEQADPWKAGSQVKITRGADGQPVIGGRPLADLGADGDAGQYDHEKFAVIRKPDGSVEFRPRTPGDNAAPSEPGEAGGAGQDTIKLVGEDGKEFLLTADDVASLMEQRSLEQARRLAMPETAAGYKLELPADFPAPPQGVEFKFDEASPALSDLRNFAYQNGWDQKQLSGALAIYAAEQVRQQTLIAQARQQQIQKLGTNASARCEAVMTWARSMVGDKLGNEIQKGMFTAGQVEAYEALMRKYVNGTGGYAGAARDAEEAGGRQRVSDAEYSRMTYTEKKQYAENFGASQSRRR